MSDRPAELDDFFPDELASKSAALASLDKAAIFGISALAVITTAIVSLVVLSL